MGKFVLLQLSDSSSIFQVYHFYQAQGLSSPLSIIPFFSAPWGQWFCKEQLQPYYYDLWRSGEEAQESGSSSDRNRKHFRPANYLISIPTHVEFYFGVHFNVFSHFAVFFGSANLPTCSFNVLSRTTWTLLNNEVPPVLRIILFALFAIAFCRKIIVLILGCYYYVCIFMLLCCLWFF